GGARAGPGVHLRGAATLATAASTAAAEKPAETHSSPIELSDPNDATIRMIPATAMRAKATAYRLTDPRRDRPAGASSGRGCARGTRRPGGMRRGRVWR